MIDGASAQALDDIAARVKDLSNQFRPGYVPVLDDDRMDGGVHAIKSLDALHAVAPESTYFAASDAQGRRFYSRDGAFQLVGGALQTREGAAVLGYGPGATTLQPLRSDRVDGTLGRIADAKIEADGTVAYMRKAVDPQTGKPKTERVVIGRIALAQFPSGVHVDAADGVHVTAPAGTEPRIAAAGSGGFGSLIPQSDDRGGIDMKRGLTHLRDAYVAFSALQSAHNAKGKTDKVVMDMVK